MTLTTRELANILKISKKAVLQKIKKDQLKATQDFDGFHIGLESCLAHARKRESSSLYWKWVDASQSVKDLEAIQEDMTRQDAQPD